jgi:hypothetical protein
VLESKGNVSCDEVAVGHSPGVIMPSVIWGTLDALTDRAAMKSKTKATPSLAALISPTVGCAFMIDLILFW